MVKKLSGLVLAIGLAVAGAVSLSQADEDVETIQAHSLAPYPGGVQEHDTGRTHLLSKDDLTAVKAFYEKHLLPGDRLEPFKTEDRHGFKLIFHRTIAGREQSVMELEFSAKPVDAILHPALAELHDQLKLGTHSAAEYKDLEKQYKTLTAAYFRMVKDDSGRRVSEGDAIYAKAAKAAHGEKPAEMSADERARGKAKAKEIQKEMKALKAKGDIAGMMRLSQERSQSLKIPKTEEAAIASMNKDTWDIWVKCLQDSAAAAYWTRLQYNESSLPQ